MGVWFVPRRGIDVAGAVATSNRSNYQLSANI